MSNPAQELRNLGGGLVSTARSITGGIAGGIENVIRNPLPVIETAVLISVGVPPVMASAAVTAANGGNLEDIALAAAKSYAGQQIGSYVGNELAPNDFQTTDAQFSDAQLIKQVVTSASGSAAVAALSGQPLDKVLSAAASGAVYQYVSQDLQNMGINPGSVDNKLISNAVANATSALMQGKKNVGEIIGQSSAAIALGSAISSGIDSIKSNQSTGQSLMDRFNQVKSSASDFFNTKLNPLQQQASSAYQNASEAQKSFQSMNEFYTTNYFDPYNRYVTLNQDPLNTTAMRNDAYDRAMALKPDVDVALNNLSLVNQDFQSKYDAYNSLVPTLTDLKKQYDSYTSQLTDISGQINQINEENTRLSNEVGANVEKFNSQVATDLAAYIGEDAASGVKNVIDSQAQIAAQQKAEDDAKTAGFPDLATSQQYNGNFQQYQADLVAQQNHQTIMDTFHNVLGRDPTPEEYQKFAGDNAIQISQAITPTQPTQTENTIPVKLPDGSTGSYDPATGNVTDTSGNTVVSGSDQTTTPGAAIDVAGPYRVDISGVPATDLMTAQQRAEYLKGPLPTGTILANQDTPGAYYDVASNAYVVKSAPAEITQPIEPVEIPEDSSTVTNVDITTPIAPVASEEPQQPPETMPDTTASIVAPLGPTAPVEAPAGVTPTLTPTPTPAPIPAPEPAPETTPLPPPAPQPTQEPTPAPTSVPAVLTAQDVRQIVDQALTNNPGLTVQQVTDIVGGAIANNPGITADQVADIVSQQTSGLATQAQFEALQKAQADAAAEQAARDKAAADAAAIQNAALQKQLEEQKAAQEAAATAQAAASAQQAATQQKAQQQTQAQSGLSALAGAAPTGGTSTTASTPLQAQFLTSKGGTSSFINPLAAVLALSKAGLSGDNLGTQQNTMQTPHYSYGNIQSVDEILGMPDYLSGLNEQPQEQQVATGGLMASPLMAAAGGVAGTRYGQYAAGGLPGNVVHHSGKARVDFRRGDAVTGAGDGQSDDIPAMLADGEFVFPADVVAAIGNGSTKAGSDKLYDMMHGIRAHVRSAKPKDLPPEIKSPLDFLGKKHRKA